MKSVSKLVVIFLFYWQCVPGGNAAEVDFNRDIRPILSANCYACHGPEDEGRKADLRLDQYEGATDAAIVPGKPGDSELITRIETDDEDERMPPPKTGHSLTRHDKDLLRAWIASGAEYAEHWAFTLPEKNPLPEIKHAEWPSKAIDHFILAKLEEAGLGPSPQADPYQLLRRLSLDLTGLPPGVEEADRFAADPTSQAYDAAIERLLDSDAFGEHWARMWLDLARYADTKGYEKDLPRTIWRYRDWVIDALNQDMSFDDFTLHQLAGDLLPDAGSDELLATAFHRNTMVNEEGGTDDEEFRVAAVKDRVDTTIQVWMGLTMGCSKCHSHKYDPLTINDYYSTFAIFNQTEDSDRGDDAPTLPCPDPQQSAQISDLEQQISAVEAQIEEKPAGFDQAFERWASRMRAEAPFWRPLEMDKFESKRGVVLVDGEDGVLVASGKRPADDEWRLTVLAPDLDRAITALRLDILPPSLTGSAWEQDNMTIQFSLELQVPGAEPELIKLRNARASFQQSGWDVRFAIDDSPERGWALSGGEKKHQVAVFDLIKPLVIPTGAKLQLRIDFPYKHSLIPSGLRFSVSTLDTDLLAPVVDPMSGLEQMFAQIAHPEMRRLREEKGKLDAQLVSFRKKIPNTPILRELPQERRRTTHIHLRGNFLDQAAEPVEPAVPVAFGKLPTDVPPDRAALARWLCSDGNPLTARVMANRVWARLFGIGIVETEEDFGSQGSVPSHPELLNWLAVDYRDGGWSLKDLLRTIVRSSTYRQSSTVTEDRLAKDPRNRLLSRGPRFRLSAETVRDQSLAASGLLTRKVGGPSVFPPQPSGVWKTTYSTLKWQDATGEDRYRRGLYTFLKRTSPHPAMSAFDAGSGEVCQIRRVRTNTPLQSLVTLNDPAFLEAAGALSKQMTDSSQELASQIAHGFRQVLIRKPSEAEISRLSALYHSLGDGLDKEAFLASAGLGAGDPAMVAVASVILNLDETLTKP